jgi:hypothetical protein
VATKIAPKPLDRPLYEVAAEIKRDYRAQGKPVFYAAVPYLDALSMLDKITDRYFEDSALSVITYLVSNLGTWRGETARRVKAELNAAVADARAKGVRW